MVQQIIRIMNEDKLHQKARDIMERLNEKYKIANFISLDEYLYEYKSMLKEHEISEILECIKEFDKIEENE